MVAINSYHAGGDFIYRPRITLRNGRILYAWQVGKTAFRIPVTAAGKAQAKAERKARKK
jgi:hypothetical protein